MKALIFCGYHNTGKTTLIEKAVAALCRRGYSVITVKHTPKSHTHTRDSSINDTGRLLEAGSQIAIQVTNDALIQYRRLDRTESGEAPPGIHPPGIHPPGIHPLGIHPLGIHPPGIHPPGTEHQTTCSKLHRKQSAASVLPVLFGELDGDFALIEGFKNYEGLPRIVFGHTRRDILRLATNSTIAFSGWEIEKRTPLALETGSKIPYISVDTGADVLADFIGRHAVDIEA